MENQRTRVIEFNPALEYLDEVVRHLSSHVRAHACQDSMLKPLLERAAAKCALIAFSPGVATFRFDHVRGKHRRGARYTYSWGTCNALVQTLGMAPCVVPTPSFLTGQDLLDAVNLMLAESVLDL